MNIPRILRNAFFFWLSLSAAAEQTQRNSRPLGRRGAALDELQPGEVSLQERDFFSQEDALAPVLSESPEMTVSKLERPSVPSSYKQSKRSSGFPEALQLYQQVVTHENKEIWLDTLSEDSERKSALIKFLKNPMLNRVMLDSRRFFNIALAVNKLQLDKQSQATFFKQTLDNYLIRAAEGINANNMHFRVMLHCLDQMQISKQFKPEEMDRWIADVIRLSYEQPRKLTEEIKENLGKIFQHIRNNKIYNDILSEVLEKAKKGYRDALDYLINDPADLAKKDLTLRNLQFFMLTENNDLFIEYFEQYRNEVIIQLQQPEDMNPYYSLFEYYIFAYNEKHGLINTVKALLHFYNQKEKMGKGHGQKYLSPMAIELLYEFQKRANAQFPLVFDLCQQYPATFEDIRQLRNKVMSKVMEEDPSIRDMQIKVAVWMKNLDENSLKGWLYVTSRFNEEFSNFLSSANLAGIAVLIFLLKKYIFRFGMHWARERLQEQAGRLPEPAVPPQIEESRPQTERDTEEVFREQEREAEKKRHRRQAKVEHTLQITAKEMEEDGDMVYLQQRQQELSDKCKKIQQVIDELQTPAFGLTQDSAEITTIEVHLKNMQAKLECCTTRIQHEKMQEQIKEIEAIESSLKDVPLILPKKVEFKSSKTIVEYQKDLEDLKVVKRDFQQRIDIYETKLRPLLSRIDDILLLLEVLSFESKDIYIKRAAEAKKTIKELFGDANDKSNDITTSDKQIKQKLEELEREKENTILEEERNIKKYSELLRSWQVDPRLLSEQIAAEQGLKKEASKKEIDVAIRGYCNDPAAPYYLLQRNIPQAAEAVGEWLKSRVRKDIMSSKLIFETESIAQATEQQHSAIHVIAPRPQPQFIARANLKIPQENNEVTSHQLGKMHTTFEDFQCWLPRFKNFLATNAENKVLGIGDQGILQAYRLFFVLGIIQTFERCLVISRSSDSGHAMIYRVFHFQSLSNLRHILAHSSLYSNTCNEVDNVINTCVEKLLTCKIEGSNIVARKFINLHEEVQSLGKPLWTQFTASNILERLNEIETGLRVFKCYAAWPEAKDFLPLQMALKIIVAMAFEFYETLKIKSAPGLYDTPYFKPMEKFRNALYHDETLLDEDKRFDEALQACEGLIPKLRDITERPLADIPPPPGISPRYSHQKTH